MNKTFNKEPIRILSSESDEIYKILDELIFPKVLENSFIQLLIIIF